MGLVAWPGEAGGSGGAPGMRDQCTVWCARGALPPEPLLAGLKRRDVLVSCCDDAFNAVARACLMARHTPAGAAALLVLCEPTSLALLGETYDALKRFVPRVAVWWYHGGAAPTLKPVALEDIVEWTAGDAAGGRTEAPVARAGGAFAPANPPMSPRFTGQNPRGSQGGPGLRLVQTESEAGAGGTSPTALTSEELAMLLGEQAPGAPDARGEAS